MEEFDKKLNQLKDSIYTQSKGDPDTIYRYEYDAMSAFIKMVALDKENKYSQLASELYREI